MRLLLVASAVSVASPAPALVKCRTADGKTVFADQPPPGCEPEGEYQGSTRPAEERAAERSDEAATPTATVPEKVGTPTPFEARPTPTISEQDRKDARVAIEVSIKRREELESAARELADERHSALARLAAPGLADEERSRLEGVVSNNEVAISVLRQEFDRLTSRVQHVNGGDLPASWPTFSCDRCP